MLLPLKRLSNSVLFCALILFASVASGLGQDRARVAKSKSKIKTEAKKTTAPTRKVIVVGSKKNPPSLVKKTVDSKSAKTNDPKVGAFLSAVRRSMMLQSIKVKIGIRYRYGTQGPTRYDCSGFVWKVFGESGIDFTRTSARTMWNSFAPVFGDNRYQFGTLVFFNRLGHMGIVVDEKGFYHASSSQGVMYSEFDSYWTKRIVGFRRVIPAIGF